MCWLSFLYVDMVWKPRNYDGWFIYDHVKSALAVSEPDLSLPTSALLCGTPLKSRVLSPPPLESYWCTWSERMFTTSLPMQAAVMVHTSREPLLQRVRMQPTQLRYWARFGPAVALLDEQSRRSSPYPRRRQTLSQGCFHPPHRLSSSTLVQMVYLPEPCQWK